MTAYVIKRLLLMIPTTFTISLVMFVIMNAAPGRPGAQLPSESRAAADVMNAAQRESYRIFKNQFALDKPILFNTRFSTTREEVRRLLVTIRNRGRAFSSGEVIRATEELEDLGRYAVAPLIEILDDPDPEIRLLAVRSLVMNAQEQVLTGWELRRRGPEAEARNKRVAKENRYLKTLIYSPSDPETKKKEIVAKWKAWYRKNEDRFRFSTGEKIKIFFLDTRFATGGIFSLWIWVSPMWTNGPFWEKSRNV